MNESTNETAWTMRINAAANALKTTPAELEIILKGIGIEKDPMGVEMLDDEEVFKFGDFREAAKDKPIAALRMAMKYLRPVRAEQVDVDPRTKQLQALGFKTKLEDADTHALLELYDANKPTDPVTNALKKRFGTRPIIAFMDDGKVAVDETMKYVGGLEQGYPEQESVKVGSKLVKLWPVGTKPNVMVEEDPMFTGIPLREGSSTVNFRDWSKISLPCRQLCRIIVDRGEINPENKEAALRLLERAQSYDALSDAYPEAEQEFRDKALRNELPKLMVPLGSAGSKPQNPFGIRRQY